MNRDSASTADADACRSQFARSLAVVIGIGDYTSGIPTLTTPVNDATYLARSLAREHGYEVRLLVTEVIKAKLETKLSEELARELGPDDRLLVYFAGHGVALDGDDGPAGYLLPQDADPDDRSTFLPMTELHGWLNNLPCRHLLLILDCCFAGAFRWASTRHIGVLPDVIHKERFDRFLQSPAWQVITSASYDQRALDVLTGSVVSCLGTRKEHSDRHSPFAQAFFAGLAGEGDVVPKGQGDGVITASELALYLRQIVEVEVAQRATLEQTPQIWPLNKHRKGEYIFLVPGHPLNLPPAETLTARNNPYRGLRPYEREHQELFFGREEETEELLARIESQPFVAVLGASGTGKSSLVKAGLLPRLADADPGWCVLPPIRPTDHPVQALGSLLRENLPGIPFAPDARHGLAQTVAAWKADNPGMRLVLTIDQCEELVTLCHDEDERERFVTLLAEAVRFQPDAFRLVLTLRSDFEPQLAQDTLLESGWLAARYVVPPMDQSDLRDVIEGPASVRVLYFEPPELVDKLINEVVQMPGALPLLSFTLSEMYLRCVRSGRDNRALTQGDYQALGGVIGSLRQRASEEHDALPDDAHRATMQRVMLRMISAEGSELARRRVTVRELEYPTAEENDRVEAVLERLVSARLLLRGTSENADGDSETYVEPAHDALVLAWDRLLQWKRQAEEYLPLQRRTAQAALEWARAPESEKAGLLWNDDPRLPQLERALTPARQARRGPLARVRRALWPDAAAPRDTAWLNRDELAFTQASVLRRAAVLKRIVGITAAVIIVLAGLAVVAWVQAGLARDNAAEAVAEADRRATEVVVRITAQAAEADARQVAQTREADAQAAATAEAEARDLAEQRRAKAEAEARRSRGGELAALALAAPEWIPDQSLLLAVEAMSTTLKANEPAVPSAQQALRDVLGRPSGLPLGSGDGIYSDVAAFSPDSRWLATASGYSHVGMNFNVQLWSTADPLAAAVVLRGQPSEVSTMAFSPDGHWLATGSLDRNVRLWRTSDLEAEPIVLHGGSSSIAAVQFSPDGRWLAALDEGYAVTLWDVSGPHVDLQVTRDPAGASEDQDTWLDSAALAFSRDGKWLATAGPESTALLWNVAGGLARSAVLRGHQSEVRAVAFSSDGRWLATGSTDHTVRLWDVAHPQADPRVLHGHEYGVTAVAFSPDSTRLLTGREDRVALLWDLARPEAEPVVLRNSEYWNETVAFSPDGQWMVTGSQWETHLWNASDPLATPKILWGHQGSVESSVFSPDSRWLATTAHPATGASRFYLNETIRLWDMSDLRPDPVVLAGHESSVWAVAVSASGRRVATAPWYSGGPVRLWDLTDPPGEPEVAETFTGTVRTLAFSPDDSQLAAACDDGFVRLWNPSDLGAAAIVLGSDEGNGVLGFSPDGIWLVNGSDSGTVRLWNLADTRAEPSLLQGHSDRVTAADFSSDGCRLATSSADGTVRVYDLGDLQTEPLVLQSDDPQVGDVAFSPDGRWLATGHGGATLGSSDSYPARLWDLTDPSLQPAVLPGHKDNAGYVAFSPDGRWLATAPGSDFDTGVRLWEVDDPESPPLLLKGNEEMILAMAFTPDSRWLATGSADDTAHLWDMANPQAEPVTLEGHTEMVEALAFSPDSRWLVTGSRDTTAFAWRIRQDELMTLACLFAGRNFALDEWQRYFPDEPYRKTCVELPVHPSVVEASAVQMP